MSYKIFFWFQKEPFTDILLEDLYPLPGLQAVTERFLYALSLIAVSIMTGDVGSGKLQPCVMPRAGKLHPSQYCAVSIVATTGRCAIWDWRPFIQRRN